MSYAKLFAAILDSSLWDLPHTTRIVWITMMAMCDRDGFVEAGVPGITHRARVSRPECEEALRVLSSPDPDSKSKAYEGARIIRVDRGWLLVNYEHYRDKESADDRREKTAERMRRLRARRAARHAPPAESAAADVTRHVTLSDAALRDVTPVTPSDQAQISTPLPPEGGRDVAPLPPDPEPPPDDPDQDPVRIARRLRQIGWRDKTNPFTASRLVRVMVATQGLTLSAVERLWELAQRRGDNPRALLGSWLDPDSDRAPWKVELAEGDNRAKEAGLRQRRSDGLDELCSTTFDPRPAGHALDGLLRGVPEPKAAEATA